jgi:hypothetical protein
VALGVTGNGAGSEQHAETTNKIARGAVTGARIASNRVTASDIDPSTPGMLPSANAGNGASRDAERLGCRHGSACRPKILS